MLKSFAELRKIDVLPYCEKREAKDENGRKIQVPYLNWAKCKDLLHENGAEVVYFEPLVNENGSTLFMTDVPFTDSKGNKNRCDGLEQNLKNKDYTPMEIKTDAMELEWIWKYEVK